MGMVDLLKKMFGNQEIYEQAHYAILSLNDIVALPKREDFLESRSCLEKIELYKKEYLDVLKQNKTITSVDLMSEELYNFKNIYVDLLLNLCSKDDTNVSFEPVRRENHSGCEYLEKMITLAKLKLYQQEVFALEEEARLRIVAIGEIVQELSNGKLFAKVRDRDIMKPLLLEMRNLHCSLIMFMNQREGMELEVNAYLQDIERMPLDDFSIDYSSVWRKLEEVRNAVSLLIPEKLKYLDSLQLDSKLLLAKMEQELEVYLYTHPGQRPFLNQQVEKLQEEIQSKLKDSTIIASEIRLKKKYPSLGEEKQKYVEKLQNLENLYKICSKYRRNFIYKKDLEKLYEIKLQLLIMDLFEQEDSVFLGNVGVTEYECYSDFISKKFESIMTGSHPIVQKLGVHSKMLRLLIQFLKNGKSKFLVEDVLHDTKRLLFLFALDKEDGLEEFFNRFMCSKEEYLTLDYYDEFFTWEDRLPLSTIFRIQRCNLYPDSVSSKKNLISDVLYSLYVSCVESDSNYYFLPEGLQTICMRMDYLNDLYIVKHHPELVQKRKAILYWMQQLTEGEKTIVLPSSLKSIEGDFFQGVTSPKIILNDGLSVKGYKTLDIVGLQHIVYPFYVNHFYHFSFDWKNIQTVTVPYYNTFGSSYSIIRALVDCYGKYLVSRSCSGYTETYLFKPSFDALIFEKEDGSEVTFTRNDLTFCHQDFVRLSDSINSSEREIIYKFLADVFQHKEEMLESSVVKALKQSIKNLQKRL